MKIAVASGKGGTGKTFFSTNLFYALRQEDSDVTLVDCDAEVPDAALFLHGKLVRQEDTRILCPHIDAGECIWCGQCSGICHFHAVTCIPSLKYLKLQEDLCHGCGACMKVCPRNAIVEDYKRVGKVSIYADGKNRPCLIEARLLEGEHSPVPSIRHAIRLAEESASGWIILDAPPGCSCPFVNTVMDADKVILVSEPTPFGLSDLENTVEVLRKLGKDFCAVINKADIGSGEMKSWLAGQHIPVLAEIPYSREIASVYARGQIAVRELGPVRELFKEIIVQISRI